MLGVVQNDTRGRLTGAEGDTSVTEALSGTTVLGVGNREAGLRDMVGRVGGWGRVAYCTCW